MQSSPTGVPYFIDEETFRLRSKGIIYLGVGGASLENDSGTSQWPLSTEDMRWYERLQINS